MFIVAQFLGGGDMLLVWLFYKDHFDISADPGAIPGHLRRRPCDPQPGPQHPVRSDRHVRAGPGGAVRDLSDVRVGTRKVKVGMGTSGRSPSRSS